MSDKTLISSKAPLSAVLGPASGAILYEPCKKDAAQRPLKTAIERDDSICLTFDDVFERHERGRTGVRPQPSRSPSVFSEASAEHDPNASEVTALTDDLEFEGALLKGCTDWMKWLKGLCCLGRR